MKKIRFRRAELALDVETLFGIAGPTEDASDPFTLFTASLEDVAAGGMVETNILRRDLPTSSEGMFIDGNQAFVTIDGGEGSASECAVESRQYRIELPSG